MVIAKKVTVKKGKSKDILQIERLKKRLASFKQKFDRHESVILQRICKELQRKIIVLQYQKDKDTRLEKAESEITNIDALDNLVEEFELDLDIFTVNSSLKKNNSKLARKHRLRKIAEDRLKAIIENAKKLGLDLKIPKKLREKYIRNICDILRRNGI